MQKDIILSQDLLDALEKAKKSAQKVNHIEYHAGHLLKAILHRDFSLLKELEAMGIDVYFIEEWADVRIEETKKHLKPVEPILNEAIETVITEAEQIRDLLNQEEVTLYAIMVALATPGVGFNFDQMKSFPVSRTELLHQQNGIDLHQEMMELPTERASTKFIHKYCVDKLSLLKKKKPIVVGREKELKEITEIICRFNKPNVLLKGYAGVGKSVLIDGFIQLIIENKVPEKLTNVAVFEVNIGTLLSGASHKSEVDERIKKIVQELKSYPRVILIIDGLHSILDKHHDNAGLASVLKSELSSNITLITTTTIDEYTKKIEKDESLSGLFEVIEIDEPTNETAFRMIKAVMPTYSKFHDTTIEDETIKEAIRLANRFLKEKTLPESALMLLDRTMSVIKTSGESFLKEKIALLTTLEDISQKVVEEQGQELKWFYDDLQQKAHYLLTQHQEEIQNIAEQSPEEQLKSLDHLIGQLTQLAQHKKNHVDAIDVCAIIAQKTGIPIGKLQSQEQERLQNMEQILRERVVGQDKAIQIVSEAILESRAGLTKAGQPIASFFFLGPTGTGKTELAKSLASFLFQDENAIIRFDMSEFKEEHSAALLYGAPPGYVGYEEGGLLVNKIRQKPYSIVLFDEIEKAHPSVFDVFLQVMDEGKLHDRLGKEGDFSNALILFTSNIGANYIVDSFNQTSVLPTSNQLIEIMAKHFRPEFLGRLTEIIPFAPITLENATTIFDIHLKKELISLLDGLSIQLKIDDEAKAFLVKSGFNATYGARPLKGIIRSELRRPLARKIISNQLQAENTVLIQLQNGSLDWQIITS